MGILGKVGAWIATNLPTMVKVAKKVAVFTKAAADLVEAYMEGRPILVEQRETKSSRSDKPAPDVRPDFMDDGKTENDKFENLFSELDQSKKTIAKLDENNVADHRKISLQIDVMELIISAQTFERFTNNVSIHASNLNIHLQAIRNQAGMLDAINRQRVGIKALMGTVNHLINVLGVKEKVDKIEGIDIDMRQGAVSIIDSYKAFEETKDLLHQELISYHDAIEQQFARVERVRNAARKVPGMLPQISQWLEKSVEPHLKNAKEMTIDLKCEIEMVPKLEAELRRELDEKTKTDEIL